MKSSGSDFGVDISWYSHPGPCSSPLTPIISQVNTRPEMAAQLLIRNDGEGSLCEKNDQVTPAEDKMFHVLLKSDKLALDLVHPASVSSVIDKLLFFLSLSLF